MTDPILVARHGDVVCELLPGLANRHGLITGATGTGKTITLQKLAEGFSAIGVPVFMADVKGDLSGIAAAGVESPKLVERLDLDLAHALAGQAEFGGNFFERADVRTAQAIASFQHAPLFFRQLIDPVADQMTDFVGLQQAFGID